MGPLGWTRRGFVLSDAEEWAISLEWELEANKWTQSPQARKDDKRKSNNPPKWRRSKQVAAAGSSRQPRTDSCRGPRPSVHSLFESESHLAGAIFLKHRLLGTLSTIACCCI